MPDNSDNSHDQEPVSAEYLAATRGRSILDAHAPPKPISLKAFEVIEGGGMVVTKPVGVGNKTKPLVAPRTGSNGNHQLIAPVVPVLVHKGPIGKNGTNGTNGANGTDKNKPFFFSESSADSLVEKFGDQGPVAAENAPRGEQFVRVPVIYDGVEEQSDVPGPQVPFPVSYQQVQAFQGLAFPKPDKRVTFVTDAMDVDLMCYEVQFDDESQMLHLVFPIDKKVKFRPNQEIQITIDGESRLYWFTGIRTCLTLFNIQTLTFGLPPPEESHE